MSEIPPATFAPSEAAEPDLGLESVPLRHQILASVEAEPRNGYWAAPRERALASAVQAAIGSDGVQVIAIECRSRSCIVGLVVEPGDDELAVREHLWRWTQGHAGGCEFGRIGYEDVPERAQEMGLFFRCLRDGSDMALDARESSE